MDVNTIRVIRDMAADRLGEVDQMATDARGSLATDIWCGRKAEAKHILLTLNNLIREYGGNRDDILTRASTTQNLKLN